MTRALWIARAAALALALAAPARAAEVCGDGRDNDGNGMADEGCSPGLQTGVCESPLSCSDTGWVGWATGALRYDLPPDVAPKSPWGPQIPFRRVYTSQYAPLSTPSSFNRTPLGPRWQHNYMTWIDRLPSDDPLNYDVVVHTLQGEDVFVSGQTRRPQPGYHFTIGYPDEYCDCYQVMTMDGLFLMYDGRGQLLTMTDRFNNTVRFTWTATPKGSAVSTVTDATGVRRLSFGYDSDSLLTSVELQFRTDPSTWTARHRTTYDYAGGHLARVSMVEVVPGESQPTPQLAQSNVYTGGYLTRINDGEGRRLVAFRFSSVRAGEANLIEATDGTVGFDFNSARNTCSGKTALYFNKANTNSCTSDAQCGGGAMCSGRTDSPGACFRGARCLTVDSSSRQSLVTGVSSIGPGSEPCTGACAEVTEYAWNNATLDLSAVKGAKDARGTSTYTTAEYNSYGLPTRIVYADTDASAGNGGGQQTVYLTYEHNQFGPLLSGVFRPSAIGNGANCSATQDAGCARTRYTYTPGGALASVTQSGYTLSSTGSVTSFSYATRYTYDSVGRVTSINGPLPRDPQRGELDLTLYTYHPASAGLTQYGFLANRATRATVPTLGAPMSEQLDTYDFWGNPIEWLDVNGQRRCQTYDLTRNYLKTSSVGMTDASRCDDPAANLIEEFSRDSALRLTQMKRADGSCALFEYDDAGRLLRTRVRDDCDRASAGDRAEYAYDADGQLIERTTYDEAGKVRHKALATYYDSRRLQGVPNPVDPSQAATLAYDERGVVTAINSEQGLGRTEFDVDASYRVRAVSRFSTPNTTSPDKWRLAYDALGRMTTVTDPDPDDKSLVITYDDLGRPVRQVSPDQTSMNVERSFTALSRVESETNLMQRRNFTHDALGRLLTADYEGDCGGATPHPEVEHVYDGLQGRTCPDGRVCANLKGRLAYARVTLMCSGEFTDDRALDQETFYSYDAAGRLIGEYIRDDTRRRVADHIYAWTKGGALAQVTLPSTAAIGWTYGGTGNSDTDRVTAVWRDTPETQATPIIENVQWNPFGPLKQYDRKDKIVGSPLRMRIERNLAYRIRSIALEGQTLGGPYYRVALSEDAKGRVTKRDYDALAGVFDSYFLYDGQDRLLCEATTEITAGCPTSGPALKNNHVAGFTGAGDRRTLLRPVTGSAGGVSNVFALAAGTHRIESVAQTDGGTPLGITRYSYDPLGRRTDEEQPGLLTSHARRTYTYDARGNLVTVRGTAPAGDGWHDYFMQSAFDARNRRVFKAVQDLATQKQQHWYFYYDAYDRLTEVVYIPDASVPEPVPSTTYQLVWLDDLLVAYWQTDSPSETTTRRYTSFDETGRPVRMHHWKETGDSQLVWAINPDAWGLDTVVLGSGVYQPIGFAGQYIDVETASYLSDPATGKPGARHRPGLALNGFRTYDPFTGSYLQVDPLVKETWNAYGYADGNPVGRSDPSGLKTFEWVCGGGPPDPEYPDAIVMVCWSQPTGEWAGGLLFDSVIDLAWPEVLNDRVGRVESRDKPERERRKHQTKDDPCDIPPPPDEKDAWEKGAERLIPKALEYAEGKSKLLKKIGIAKIWDNLSDEQRHEILRPVPWQWAAEVTRCRQEGR